MMHTFTDRLGRSIDVRRAHEDDAGELIAYTKRVDAETPFLSREPGEFAIPVAQERMFIKATNARPNSIFLVALHDGLFVGTIDFHGGTRARTEHAGEFGMSVRREYWGAGIGGHLLDTMLTWAAGTGQVQKVKLRVQATNTPAIALYRSRGFVEEGCLQREMRVHGEWVDVIMMSRWLGG